MNHNLHFTCLLLAAVNHLVTWPMASLTSACSGNKTTSTSSFVGMISAPHTPKQAYLCLSSDRLFKGASTHHTHTHTRVCTHMHAGLVTHTCTYFLFMIADKNVCLKQGQMLHSYHLIAHQHFMEQINFVFLFVTSFFLPRFIQDLYSFFFFISSQGLKSWFQKWQQSCFWYELSAQHYYCY